MLFETFSCAQEQHEKKMLKIEKRDFLQHYNTHLYIGCAKHNRGTQKTENYYISHIGRTVCTLSFRRTTWQNMQIPTRNLYMH